MEGTSRRSLGLSFRKRCPSAAPEGKRFHWEGERLIRKRTRRLEVEDAMEGELEVCGQTKREEEGVGSRLELEREVAELQWGLLGEDEQAAMKWMRTRGLW